MKRNSRSARSLVKTRPSMGHHAFLGLIGINLVAAAVAFLLAACNGGGSGAIPVPAGAKEWFFVESFTGQVSGFSAASGQLEPIPGSLVSFVPPSPSPPLLLLTSFAVAPTGMFLAVTASPAQGAATLQIANIASGGAISVTPLSAAVANAFRMAISSQGVIAVSDGLSAIQFFAVQNIALLAGPTCTECRQRHFRFLGCAGSVLAVDSKCLAAACRGTVGWKRGAHSFERRGKQDCRKHPRWMALRGRREWHRWNDLGNH